MLKIFKDWERENNRLFNIEEEGEENGDEALEDINDSDYSSKKIKKRVFLSRVIIHIF